MIGFRHRLALSDDPDQSLSYVALELGDGNVERGR